MIWVLSWENFSNLFKVCCPACTTTLRVSHKVNFDEILWNSKQYHWILNSKISHQFEYYTLGSNGFKISQKHVDTINTPFAISTEIYVAVGYHLGLMDPDWHLPLEICSVCPSMRHRDCCHQGIFVKVKSLSAFLIGNGDGSRPLKMYKAQWVRE